MITWRAALDPDNHKLEMRHMGYDSTGKHVATVDRYKGSIHYSAFAVAVAMWDCRSFDTVEEAKAWCEKVVASRPGVWREATLVEMDRAKGQFITRSPFLDANREERRKKWLHLRTQAKAWKETACRLAREVADNKAAPDTDLKDLKDEMAACQKLAAYWEERYKEATAKLQQVDANTAPLRGELDALREGAKKLREEVEHWKQMSTSNLNNAKMAQKIAEEQMARREQLLDDKQKLRQCLDAKDAEIVRLREERDEINAKITEIYRDMFGSVSGGAE